jgi:hypothetical protein
LRVPIVSHGHIGAERIVLNEFAARFDRYRGLRRAYGRPAMRLKHSFACDHRHDRNERHSRWSVVSIS